MAWVDSTYLENMIGEDQVNALGLTGSIFTQFELKARSGVLSVLQYAGYSDPGETITSLPDTTQAMLQSLVACRMIADAYGLRKGIELGKSLQASISEAMSTLRAIHDERLPIPGLTPNPKNAYGGVKFNTANRKKVFDLRGTDF